MKTFDVTALGELLIDFTENGESEQGNRMLEANPGGAPANVLAMLNKLGKRTAFIGKVGNDPLGHYLREAVAGEGIDIGHLLTDDTVHTTLAFVHKKADGDRDFCFYRNPGADMMLTEDEVPEELIRNTRIFHYGSLSMTHPEVRKATLKAIRTAKESGCLLSFDPNLREPLWDSLETAKARIAEGMEYCDILKISDNELIWFTGKEDFDEGIAVLKETYGIPLILLTKGKEGSSAYFRGVKACAEPFLQDHTVDTTGAGDTFCGCALNYVLEKGLDGLTKDDLEQLLTFANAAASLITTRKGALRSMPEKADVEALIRTRRS